MVKLQIMNSSNHVWGELEDPDHRKLNITSTEKELLCRIPRPLSLEGPRIHQPKIDLVKTASSIKSENMNNSLSKQPPKKSKSNESYVTHGVQILTYINELNKIKEVALARRERGLPG